MPDSPAAAVEPAASHVAVVPDREDGRVDPPFLGDEREVLEAWLELCRESVLLKIAGLSAEQLAQRSVPPSTMSPLGIVRHLTEVERYWFRDVTLGEDSPDLYSRRDAPDADFDEADAANAPTDIDRYVDELASSRRCAAQVPDLMAPVVGLRRGQQLHLRWIYTHLIEEYARHLGHLDLLREVIDGRTGY